MAARVILQAQWVAIFVAAMVAPLVLRPWIPVAVWPWSLAIALALAISVVVSVHAWRQGADALTLAPALGRMCCRHRGRLRDHCPNRKLATQPPRTGSNLPRLIPAGVRTLMFFNEIDEGLWFYLNRLGLDVNLAPVPGCHPRYNLAYDLVENYRTHRGSSESMANLEAKRQVHDKQALIAWLDHPDPGASPYLLIRNSLYERLAGDLAGRVAPLFRETGMKRNELVLLQVIGRRPGGASTSAIATTPGPTRR